MLAAAVRTARSGMRAAGVTLINIDQVFRCRLGDAPPDLMAVDKTGGTARVVVAGGDRFASLGTDSTSL